MPPMRSVVATLDAQHAELARRSLLSEYSIESEAGSRHHDTVAGAGRSAV